MWLATTIGWFSVVIDNQHEGQMLVRSRCKADAFVTGTEAALKEWEETYKKDVPLNVPPIRENYFVVFDTCAGALGKIDSEELRAKILGAFYQAKILIEAINYQNQRSQERERLAREGLGHIAQRMDP